MPPTQRPKCVNFMYHLWVCVGTSLFYPAVVCVVGFVVMKLWDERLLAAIVCAGYGAAGALSAPHFREGRPWARTILEALTWLTLVFVLGAALFVHVACLAYPGAFAAGFSVVIGLGSVLFAIPLGVMIAWLRSDAVRNAMVPTPSDPSDESDGASAPREESSQ